MPLLGSHLSIAGGLYKAADGAAALGMETVQIFTHSPSQWSVTPVAGKLKKGESAWQGKLLKEEDIRAFREAVERHKLSQPCAHDSYLINLGSLDPELQERSIQAFIVELQRAEALGLAGVVMHPGSYVEGTEEAGLERVVSALNRVRELTEDLAVETWLEATAGQGTNLGYRFEQLAYLLREVTDSSRMGVCIDTCHIFAAGYPLKTKDEYEATIKELSQVVGLDRVRAWHINDSKKGQGSRVDRHEHIGEGCIGADAFGFLINDPRFAKLPMILETKKEKRDGEEMDAVNLRRLRGMLSKSRKN